MCTFYTQWKRLVQIRNFCKRMIYPFSKSQSPGSGQVRSRMKTSSKAMMGELAPDRITVPSKITWYDGTVRLAGMRCWATRHCRSWRRSFFLLSSRIETNSYAEDLFCSDQISSCIGRLCRCSNEDFQSRVATQDFGIGIIPIFNALVTVGNEHRRC